MPMVGKRVIPEVVITTRRIEMVSCVVSGQPRAVAAAVAIAVLTASSIASVTAARSSGSATNFPTSNSAVPTSDPVTPPPRLHRRARRRDDGADLRLDCRHGPGGDDGAHIVVREREDAERDTGDGAGEAPAGGAERRRDGGDGEVGNRGDLRGGECRGDLRGRHRYRAPDHECDRAGRVAGRAIVERVHRTRTEQPPGERRVRCLVDADSQQRAQRIARAIHERQLTTPARSGSRPDKRSRTAARAPRSAAASPPLPAVKLRTTTWVEKPPNAIRQAFSFCCLSVICCWMVRFLAAAFHLASPTRHRSINRT
jgi:hypothetical protein